jgi:dihydrofolate synthase/folylpolyglutamate synthase
MTYAETVEYLFTRLPMFSRQGAAAIRKDLTNTLLLCEALEDPQNGFRSVHVGGTNGKGSVSHMLASVMQAAGYRTGLYTSPHLYDFRERIRIDGKMIPEEFVTSFTERIQPLIETIEPSFFEITVAMAFDYFTREKVDIAIVEVGLGGRLDSTNIISPEIAVITNIGWDHMNLLGDTLQAIAAEKGGIIKPSIPVVIGERSAETDPVFTSIASRQNAPVFFAEDKRTVTDHRHSDGFLSLDVRSVETGVTRQYDLDLTGNYQLKNACTVLEAVSVLTGRGWTIPEEAIRQGLANARTTGLQGRWDVIGARPDVVLDVAHNPSGIGEMLAQVRQRSYAQVHFVIGMVRDKDVNSVLTLLPSTARYYFTQSHIPRALPAGELRDMAVSSHLHGDAYADVNEALAAARNAAHPDDIILVCGSIFLVAEVDRGDAASGQ